MRMAGATAFFTTFALPPIFIIIIQVFGLFYNQAAVKDGIFAQLVLVLGKEGSVNIYETLTQFQNLASNWLIAIGGFIFLIFVATTLFNVVRKSVNEIWCVQVEKHAGVGFYMKLRFKSLIIIFLAGLLLLVQMTASGLQVLLKDYINQIWSGYDSLLYRVISQIIFLLIATVWFTILFRYLGNAHPTMRISFIGGLFTGSLFTLGKVILGILLTFSNLRTIFGTSGSFVLILLFVFYSSFIFYFGAAFTKEWANAHEEKLQLEKYSYEYVVKETRSKSSG